MSTLPAWTCPKRWPVELTSRYLLGVGGIEVAVVVEVIVKTLTSAMSESSALPAWSILSPAQPALETLVSASAPAGRRSPIPGQPERGTMLRVETRDGVGNWLMTTAADERAGFSLETRFGSSH